MRKGSNVMGASLLPFLIICNQLSSKPVLLTRLNQSSSLSQAGVDAETTKSAVLIYLLARSIAPSRHIGMNISQRCDEQT
jgi:hypothetical protein